MVGACVVVTERLGRVSAEEYRARVLYERKIVERVVHAHFEVFGRNLVGYFHRLFYAFADNYFAVVLYRGASNGLTRHNGKLLFQLCLNGESERLAVRHEHGRSELIVFRLRKEVGRNIYGVGLAVGYDEYL